MAKIALTGAVGKHGGTIYGSVITEGSNKTYAEGKRVVIESGSVFHCSEHGNHAISSTVAKKVKVEGSRPILDGDVTGCGAVIVGNSTETEMG